MKVERKEGNKMETVSLTYAKLQITELINEIKDVPARKKGQKEFIINNSNNIKSIKDKCNEKISVSKGGVLMEHVKRKYDDFIKETFISRNTVFPRLKLRSGISNPV